MRARQVDPVELLLNHNEAGVLRMNEDLRKRCLNRQNIFFLGSSVRTAAAST